MGINIIPWNVPGDALSLAEVCGGTMRIVGCIEETATIEKILRHTSTALSAGCNLWEEAPRPPPETATGPPAGAAPTLDYAFFERYCV